MGISNIRNENEEFSRNYRFVRRLHCALVEYCIETYGIAEPSSFKNLRNDTYIKFKYTDNAVEYVEQELGIDQYSCVKDGGEFPVYDCPECGYDQLVYDAEADKYHCFHCSQDYEDGELMHCSECPTITPVNEVGLCSNCIQRKMED